MGPGSGWGRAIKSSKEQNRLRKKKLLDKARVLFWKKGYPGTSMRDLAEAFGCKPANIYNYFEKKDDILFEVLREEMEKIVLPVAHLEDEDSTDPLEQLRLFIKSHTRLTLGYRRSAKMLFDIELGHLPPAKRQVIIDMRRQYDRILCRIIERGIECGLFSAGKVKLTAYGIASMIARSRVWYSPDGDMSPDEIGDFFYEFAVTGLRGEGDGARVVKGRLAPVASR